MAAPELETIIRVGGVPLSVDVLARLADELPIGLALFDEAGRIVWVNRQHVETDAFSFAGIIEQAIAFGPLKRLRDGFSGNLLEFKHPAPLQSQQ